MWTCIASRRSTGTGAARCVPASEAHRPHDRVRQPILAFSPTNTQRAMLIKITNPLVLATELRKPAVRARTRPGEAPRMSPASPHRAERAIAAIFTSGPAGRFPWTLSSTGSTAPYTPCHSRSPRPMPRSA